MTRTISLHRASVMAWSIVGRWACAIFASALPFATSAAGLVRAEIPADASALVGTWRLVTPRAGCDVVLRIGGDGQAVLTNGAQTQRYAVGLAATTLRDGALKFSSTVQQSQGVGTCELPDRGSIIGLTPTTYARVLAGGHRLALCAFDNVGGCNQWYERVAGVALPAPGANPFSRAVERAVYGAEPERSGVFEMSLKEPLPLRLSPDLEKSEETQIDCAAAAGYYLMADQGYGGFGQLYAWDCADGERVAGLLRRLGQSADMKKLAAQDNGGSEVRRYGLRYSDELLPGGAELFTYPASASVMMVSTAALIDAGKARATVLAVVSFGACEPGSAYMVLTLCSDRVAVLRKIVTALARDPAVRP